MKMGVPALRGVVLLLGLLAMGCGYRAVHGATPAGKLSAFAIVTTESTDAALSAELEAGARGVLGRAGALRGGAGWPRLVIELVSSELSETGVARLGNEPMARAMRARVVGRAFVEASASGPWERETGLVSIEENLAVESRALVESFREEAALRAASRRLGEELARRILGEPSSSRAGEGPRFPLETSR